jgi:hypothetical protein
MYLGTKDLAILQGVFYHVRREVGGVLGISESIDEPQK